MSCSCHCWQKSLHEGELLQGPYRGYFASFFSVAVHFGRGGITTRSTVHYYPSILWRRWELTKGFKQDPAQEFTRSCVNKMHYCGYHPFS